MKTETWVLIDVVCCGDAYPIAARFGGFCDQCGLRPTPVGERYNIELDATPVRGGQVALTSAVPRRVPNASGCAQQVAA